jgi:beta-glucosidase
MSIIIHARRAATAAIPVAALAFTSTLAGRQPAPNCASSSGDRAWMDTSRSPECRAQLALAAMTPDERLSFRGSNERLGLVSPPGSDGPNGIIGGGFGVEQTPVTSGRSADVTAFPTVIALGAAWDRDLARRFGEAVGEEFHAKGMTSVTGPTINLLRTWHWGRAAETFGEDPFHMSELVVPEILGIQSRKVIAVAKHFAGNNQENTRTGVFPDNAGIDERIAEKALFEIYFPHFKAAASRARNGAVMCAYNQVNGVFSCNNTWMLAELRSWGFDGYIVPDAGYALRSTAAAAAAGVDNVNATELGDLVKAGTLPASIVDTIAMHFLAPRFRLGIYDDTTRGSAEAHVSTPEHVALARQIAESGAVLLKNRANVLPIAAPAVKSIAVIGDDAGPNVTVMETGSAHVYVDPARLKTPIDALKARAGSNIAVTYAAGTRGIGRLSPIPATVLHSRSGQTGLDGVYWTNGRFSGAPAFVRVDPAIDFAAPPAEIVAAAPGQGGTPPAGARGRAGGGRGPRPNWSARWTATLTPPSTGLYRFSLAGGGTAQLYVANRAVVTIMRADFGMVAHGTIQLTAGQPVPIEVKFSNESNLTGQHLRLGWAPPEPELLRDAVAAAKRADIAIVFAAELEGEGYDKLALGLPADQDRLIAAVAEANPRTIVVLHTSNPVAMPWLNDVAAVIEAWYPGQEAGSSIASVLFGDVNPSGKLPMTFPADESQGPATRWTEYPGDGHTANFSEGVLVGYRWYDAHRQQPLFPFGHGLSYTTFRYDTVQVQRSADAATVTVRLTNTGTRAGAEVVQLYLECPPDALEPPRQLKGFEKVVVKPGESTTVTFALDRGALSAWDEATHAWKLYPGDYTVYIGSSSRDIRAKGMFSL